jgi:hypothetical protein
MSDAGRGSQARLAMKGSNNPNFGRTLSDDTKLKMSLSRGFTIFVYSLEGQLLNTFVSSRIAAKHFNCGNATIMNYARSGKRKCFF